MALLFHDEVIDQVARFLGEEGHSKAASG